MGARNNMKSCSLGNSNCMCVFNVVIALIACSTIRLGNGSFIFHPFPVIPLRGSNIEDMFILRFPFP